ncbi:hypothetical protein RvY_01719 [Ramazzottius varieornatus]|uniref:Uncharacterized protein n=1 Tax=Ramazzottius varieornatus TaxID=947166 RepID=A0A1D1UNA4_RAMVA|nr:hypothetical protein RvY_01719 [Ramazzottius varieornatus]
MVFCSEILPNVKISSVGSVRDYGRTTIIDIMSAGFSVGICRILLLFYLFAHLPNDVDGKSITPHRSKEAVFTKSHPAARSVSSNEFDEDPEDFSEDNAAASDDNLFSTTWNPTTAKENLSTTFDTSAASFSPSTPRPRLHYQPVVLTELNWEIIVAVIFGSMAGSMLLTFIVYCMCGRPEEGHLI